MIPNITPEFLMEKRQLICVLYMTGNNCPKVKSFLILYAILFKFLNVIVWSGTAHFEHSYVVLIFIRRMLHIWLNKILHFSPSWTNFQFSLLRYFAECIQYSCLYNQLFIQINTLIREDSNAMQNTLVMWPLIHWYSEHSFLF